MMKKTVIREYLVTILLALILAFFLNNFILQFAKISGRSMEPSFYDGEIVLLSRLNRTFKRQYERGDVIVFEVHNDGFELPEDLLGFMSEEDRADYENNKSLFVKRIVGLPGEKISILNDGIYIDGLYFKEDYLEEGVMTTSYDSIEDYLIPEDRYFVLGDNRGNSTDSRMIGAIKEGTIQGKLTYRIYPWNKKGKI